MNKDFLKKIGVGGQLALLLIIVGAGFIFASIVSTVVMLFSSGEIDANLFAYRPDVVKLLQLVSSVGIFLIPAVCAIYLFGIELRYKPYSATGFMGQILGGVILIAVIQPLVQWLAFCNGQILSFEIFESVLPAMRSAESLAEAVIKHILVDTSLWGVVSSLIVIALGAAVTEELLFRGVLQNMFLRSACSPHLAVWLTAFVFSFIHLQFFGFLPRLLLGALLGYLYLWSGRLWLPILVHFVNNAVAVIGMQFFEKHAGWQWMEQIGNGRHLYAVIVSAILTSICVFVLTRKKTDCSEN